MERIAGHYDKVVLTLIMCLVILFMTTFSPFAESAKAFELVTDAVIAVILIGLVAMGITFTTTGAYDNINDYIRSLLDEYCLDHNISTSQFLNGCQSGSNKLGQLIINNRFVVAISTFASWLIAKYNLSNYATSTIEQQGNYLGNCSLTELPTEGLYIRTNYSERWEMELLQIRGSSRTYIEGNGWYIFVSDSASVVEYNLTVLNSITGAVKRTAHWEVTLSQNSFTINQYTFNPTSVFACAKQETDLMSGTFVPPIVDNSLSDMAYAINQGYEIRHNEGIAIDTGVITLPDDDDTYTEGDGAVIDLGADWGTTYQDLIDNSIPDELTDEDEASASIEYVNEEEVVEQVEDSGEITNLPAGAIPFVPLALPNFRLVNIWHYVQQWISDTAIAAGSLMSIATQAPSPMVNLFYAIVCLVIIFGFIKGLAK